MHTHKSLVALLGIVFLVFSCSSTPSKEDDFTEQSLSSDEFVSYKLAEGVPKLKWSDVIDEMEITRLEETEASLLSYVRDVHTVGEKMVFVSGNESDVFVFSQTGELVTKFNRKGEGPEEYQNIQSLWLEGDTVSIYSRGMYIKRYSLAGEFISEAKLNYDPGHALGFEGGYAFDMFFSAVDDSLFYNVVVQDKQLFDRKLLLPAERFTGFNIFTSNSTLAKYKSSFLYQRIMSDTVYMFADSIMKPMIHFDLDQKWFWKGQDGGSNNGDINEVFNSELFWNQTTKVSSGFAYVMAWSGTEGTKKFLVDRRINKIIEVQESVNDEDKYYITVSHWTEDGVFGSMGSLDVANLLNELSEEQWFFTEGTTLQEIESSENPVIVRVKLKDSSYW